MYCILCAEEEEEEEEEGGGPWERGRESDPCCWLLALALALALRIVSRILPLRLSQRRAVTTTLLM